MPCLHNLINLPSNQVVSFFKLARILIPVDTIRELVDRIIEFGPECCKEYEYFILLN